MKTSKFFFSTLIAAAAMTAPAYAEIDSLYGTLEWTTDPTTAANFYSGDYGLSFNFTEALFGTLENGESYVVAAYWGSSSSDTYGANAIVLANNNGTYSLTAGRGKLSDTDLDADTTFAFQDNVVFTQAIVANTAYTLSVVGGNSAMTPTLTWTGDPAGSETLGSYNGNMNGHSSPMNYGLLNLYYVTDSVWGGGDAGNWSEASWTTGSNANQALGSLANVTFNSSVTMTADENVTVNSITVAEGQKLTLAGTGTVGTAEVNFGTGSEIVLTETSALAWDVSSNGSNVDLSAISGTEDTRIKLSLAGDSGDSTTQAITAIGSEFDGEIEIAAGYLRVNSVDSATTLSSAKALVLSGGANVCFYRASLTYTGDIIAEGDGGALLSYGANSYAIRYEGDVTGTSIIRDWGGTHTFAGAVNLDSFNAKAGVSTFEGTATLGGLSIASNATVNVSGTLELTGASNFSGTLNVVDGGTLTLSGHDALGFNNNGLDSGVISLQGNNSTEKASLVINDFDGNDNKSMTLSKTLELKGYSTVSATEGRSFNSWNGKIKASGIENEISSTIGLRKELIVDVEDGGKLIISGNMLNGQNPVDGGLLKSGSGELTLSGNNTYTHGTTIEAGTLIAAHQSALGRGNVTVKSGATLKLAVAVENVGNVSLEEGAMFAIDVTGMSPVSMMANGNETVALSILSSSALSFNGQDASSLINSDTIDGYFDDKNSNLGQWSEWQREWSYSDGTLSLTLTIPEPSAFGLLAGVGALALVASRRRRSRR